MLHSTEVIQELTSITMKINPNIRLTAILYLCKTLTIYNIPATHLWQVWHEEETPVLVVMGKILSSNIKKKTSSEVESIILRSPSIYANMTTILGFTLRMEDLHHMHIK